MEECIYLPRQPGHQALVHPNNSSGHNALNSGVLKTGSRLEFQTSVIFHIATTFLFILD